MTWKPAIRGNSKRCYLEVGFGFAKVLWTGMVDGCKHLPRIPTAVFEIRLKHILTLNHSQLMPNLKKLPAHAYT